MNLGKKGGGWARFKGATGSGGSSTEDAKSKKDESGSAGGGSTSGGDAAKKTREVSEQQYKEIMRNMAEFKVDMKEEIGRMNEKVIFKLPIIKAITLL